MRRYRLIGLAIACLLVNSVPSSAAAPGVRFVLDLDDMFISRDVRKLSEEETWPMRSLGQIFVPPANKKAYRFLPGSIVFPYFLKNLKFFNRPVDVGVFSSYGNAERTRQIVKYAWGESPQSPISYVLTHEDITTVDTNASWQAFTGKPSHHKKDLEKIPNRHREDWVFLLENTLNHALPAQVASMVYVGHHPNKNTQLFWLAGLLLAAKRSAESTARSPMDVLYNWQWQTHSDGRLDWKSPPFAEETLIAEGSGALAEAAKHFAREPLCAISIGGNP